MSGCTCLHAIFRCPCWRFFVASDRSSFRKTPSPVLASRSAIAFSSPLMALGAVVGSAIGAAHGESAEIRRSRVRCGNLRIQLGAGGYCHVLLLPPGCRERRLADRRMRGGGCRDPLDAAPPAFSHLHHPIHRHDVGRLLHGPGPGHGPCRAGRASGRQSASLGPRLTASAR